MIVGARLSASAALRIPAAEIEQIVTSRIRQLLPEPASLFNIVQGGAGEPMPQHSLIARAVELAGKRGLY